MASLTVYEDAFGIVGNKLYLEGNGNGLFLDFGKYGNYHNGIANSIKQTAARPSSPKTMVI